MCGLGISAGTAIVYAYSIEITSFCLRASRLGHDAEWAFLLQ